jgi:sugar O-acyltransferase (sialic acid O-acetyltransferase NeuD family)
MNKVILQGGGEHARVVLDCLLSGNIEVSGVFDPKYSGTLFGVPQRGVYDPTFEPEAKAIVAIGDNALRKVVVSRTRHQFANAIHESVLISSLSTMGIGNMILHRVVIQAQAKIGNHCIINTNAQVDHDCAIDDYVHLAPGVILCGCVSIGEGAFLGAGAVVIPGKKIGAWATVGAGAIVLQDIPDYAVAVGNPATIIRYNKP